MEIIGHTPAQADSNGAGTPNLVVHFADNRTAAHLDVLTKALDDSKRNDAATAVVAVLTPDQLKKSRHVQGVIYSDDESGNWERPLGLRSLRRPATVIVGPKGNVLLQMDGELDREKLTAALRKYLIVRQPVSPRVVPPAIRTEQPPPNFLFEYAPGYQLTLRKLSGKRVVLVFWRSCSQPSIDAVQQLQRPVKGREQAVVLAINDGEDREVAKRVAAEHRILSLVTDPKRGISRAYRVSVWPTIVFIDPLGVTREVRYGGILR
jgi:peroxiredoxin